VALRVCVDRVAQAGISTLPTHTCGGPGRKERGGGWRREKPVKIGGSDALGRTDPDLLFTQGGRDDGIYRTVGRGDR
jgi:hypothetical protein